MSQALLERIEALAARLDARGQPCGQSHISAEKTCRVGRGRAEVVKEEGPDRPGGYFGATVKVPLPATVQKTVWRMSKDPSEPSGYRFTPEKVPTDAAYVAAHFFPSDSPPGGRADVVYQELAERLGVSSPSDAPRYNVQFFVGLGPRREDLNTHRQDFGGPEGNRAVAIATYEQLRSMISKLPDGTRLDCSAELHDGYGDRREQAYLAFGFEHSVVGMVGIVQGGKLARAGRRRDSAEGEEASIREAFVAALLQLPEFGADDRDDSLEARLARLDARIRQAPGQLGLDLSGGPAGKPCGRSHISAAKECHKGGGGGRAARKASITVGEGGEPGSRIRNFVVRLSGGDEPPRDVGVHIYALPVTIRFKQEDEAYDWMWAPTMHRRLQELGAAAGVQPLVKAGKDGRREIEALDLGFGVELDKGLGEIGEGLGMNRLAVGRVDGALVARNTFRQIRDLLKDLPDGSVLTCTCWTGDGYGQKRRKLYETLGFQFEPDRTTDGIAIAKGGQLARPTRSDAAVDPDEEAFIEAALQLPEFGADDRDDSLEARLARLDARIRQAPGQLGLDLSGGPAGKPCGRSHISREKECRIGGSPSKSPSKSAAGITIDADGGEPRFRGLKPTRSLGGGAFGKAYQFDTDDGPVVVKVNGLTMGDPGEADPRVGLAEQRENVARREFRNLQRAHAAGLGPETIGELTHLPDGRWSIAYRMLPGSKLCASHQTLDLTPEAAATLADPKAAARYVAGALQLARRQADSGLIHGDLHGGNILVGPDGSPSLIDWAMTQEARNPWNQAERSPATRAMDEMYALSPMLAMAGQAEGVMAAAMEEGKVTIPATNRAREAEKAYKGVIEAHDLAWEEANDSKVAAKLEPGEFHRRMVEANRIKREEDMPYDMALRDPRVGLEPPLPPEVLARAAAARDAIFGQSDLEAMRRELDRRFGAGA